jgi:PEP-CTERM motif
MYKLAFLAMIVGLSTGTLAFADVSDLSTLYLIEAGGVGGGDIVRAGTFSASGKTASGFPTKSGPEVSVSGSGKQTGSSSDDTATAESSWDVQIEGPAPSTNLLVPILISGNYGVSASGTGTSSAGIGTGLAAGLHGTVGFVLGGEFGCSPALVPSGCGSGGFALSTSADDSPLSGGIFSIFIQATGNLDGSFPGPMGSFSAFVDPHVSIDCAKAKFADCSAYSLVVAPDSFTVGSGVPEPSTWALLLIGFAGVVFAGWRRPEAPGASLG